MSAMRDKGLRGTVMSCRAPLGAGGELPYSRRFGVMRHGSSCPLRAAAVQGNRRPADIFTAHRVSAALSTLSRISHG